MTPPDEWKTYNPDPSPDAEPAGKIEPYQPPSPPTRPKKPRTIKERTVRRRSPAVPLLIGAVVIGGIGWGAVSIARSAFGTAEPQTVEGFTSLLEDIEEKNGSTEVFEAVIYPGYARVDLPLAPNDEREISYRWDGSFGMEIKGTDDAEPFDLADVDPAHFARMCDEVSALIDDPGNCYLIIRKPDDTFPDRADAWISAYVSNEFSQSASINYDLEGNEVDRSDN
ncbi:hypothetical protein [Nocardioides sp. WS12]|uniref:hypothetical protein n=1 Tax=Nocardioides sp. WS12 TaxID=2486272 RepID=UPI0015FD4E66|nr:hypothetical protein [Nocardioides sp. WS12]